MNPQGTDLDKSLLLFADESPVDEYWMAFHCATTHGLDKESLLDRVAWTRANTDHITKVATNPIEHRDLWITAEEPWTHLQLLLVLVMLYCQKKQDIRIDDWH